MFSQPSGTPLQVDGLTLDDVLEERGIDSVDLMKIDAEGSEIEVLKGARRLLSSARRPTLVFEANPEALGRAGASVDSLMEVVASFRYRIAEIESGIWNGHRVGNFVAYPNDGEPDPRALNN